MANINPIYLNRPSTPIVTGVPRPQAQPQNDGQSTEKSQVSFGDLLRSKLAQQGGLTFSKHAVSRVEQRNIDLSDSSLARLNEGVRMAQEKGLGDTLILVDSTAFIVNARNSKVITTVDAGELKGNVFTNIDGTVII